MKNRWKTAKGLMVVLVSLVSYWVNAQNLDSLETAIQQLAGSSTVAQQRDINRSFTDSAVVSQMLDVAYDNYRANRDTARLLLNGAIKRSLEAGSAKFTSKSIERLGHYFYFNDDFNQAARCYLLCLRLDEKFADEIRVAKMNLNLGRIYNYLEILQQSLDYTEKALAAFEKNNVPDKIAESYENLGLLYFNRNFWEVPEHEQRMANYETSLRYYNKALAIAETSGNELQKGKILQSIAAVYNQNGNSEKALKNIMEALEIYKRNNEPERVNDALYAIGLTYKQLGKPQIAIGYIKQVLESAIKNNAGGIHWLYETLAEANYDAGNYKESHDLYVKFINTRDSVLNLEKSRMILDLENKYQAEKKQVEIEKLILAKKQRTQVIYTLAVVLLLIVVTGIALYRSIRTKKIIADQKIIQLEKEKQLIATRSLLAGEELERTRLAGDLHDGLGGLLTGVKLKLSSMRENSIITSENLAHFNHALDLLDTSIAEMRRVAHNLMPETLMHYGLQTAVTDFIKQVKPSGLPEIRFGTFGDDLRYSREFEITVYRITQELVNNALKHAGARQIDVQLFTEPERICVQVIDDGKGFDSQNTDKQDKGKGLNNINDRVTSLGGHFEILSQPGSGTECTLEFLIS